MTSLRDYYNSYYFGYANLPDTKERRKIWRENNKEWIKTYRKIYYKHHSEWAKKYNKIWRKFNPEYQKQWHLRRKIFDTFKTLK